jgi:hypothetical protein
LSVRQYLSIAKVLRLNIKCLNEIEPSGCRDYVVTLILPEHIQGGVLACLATLLNRSVYILMRTTQSYLYRLGIAWVILEGVPEWSQQL